MSRKTFSFGQLLQYIDAPEQGGEPLVHNLHSQMEDRDGIRREFLANARLLPKRKNGNVLFHEILSFSAEDAALLTAPVLEDLVRHYLEIRAPYALAYARAHFDTDHPHVHLLISANNVAARQRLRLSKAQFRKVKTDMERYQQERYPQLQHSVAQTPHQQPRVRETRSEQERTRRGATQPTRKQTVRDLVSAELTTATSGGDSYHRLLTRGLRLYKRGRSIGVEDVSSGRRYRLKTLGLDAAFERARAQWSRLPPEITALPRRSRTRRQERGRSR